MKIPPVLLSAALFLTVASVGNTAEVIVKDDFDTQTAGQQLNDLSNWKYFGGWIKPEFGKIVDESGNKYLHMKGDIFSVEKATLKDVLTYKFKTRASGNNSEVGGLTIRSNDGKARYDILFSYGNEHVSLIADSAGMRETLGVAEGVSKNVFHDIVVILERNEPAVKFTVLLDGVKVIEKDEFKPYPFLLEEPFSAGFFTYNGTEIDIDSVEFTRGK